MLGVGRFKKNYKGGRRQTEIKKKNNLSLTTESVGGKGKCQGDSGGAARLRLRKTGGE